MLRKFIQLNPLTRLNLMVLIFLFSIQVCFVVSILFIVPSTLNQILAQALFWGPQLWCFASAIATLFLFWNAFRLYTQYRLRYKFTTPTNLALAFAAPAMLFVMVCVWLPVWSAVIDIRVNWDFERSRDDMVAICDEILAEGSQSDKIDTDAEVGRYSHVNVTLREDGRVYFDVGDESREVGYVCLPEGGDPPVDNNEYNFDEKDERFYYFEEKQDDEERDGEQRIFG